jgi:hypothetical protein
VAKCAGIAHFIYVSVAHPAPAMQAYIAARSACEAESESRGLDATILRPWYVLRPGHRSPSADPVLLAGGTDPDHSRGREEAGAGHGGTDAADAGRSGGVSGFPCQRHRGARHSCDELRPGSALPSDVTQQRSR